MTGSLTLRITSDAIADSKPLEQLTTLELPPRHQPEDPDPADDQPKAPQYFRRRHSSVSSDDEDGECRI